MKRFALFFGSLVLAIPLVGCDTGGGAPGAGTGTGPGNQDTSNWGEAKKHEAELQKKFTGAAPSATQESLAKKKH
jgi:hypothetical protein